MSRQPGNGRRVGQVRLRIVASLLILISLVLPAMTFAATATYTGSLTTTDSQQAGRLLLNGVISTCTASKSTPGLREPGTSLSYYYDKYSYTNTSSGDECITVTLTAGSPCSVGSVAYLGAFDPANVEANYLADSGNFTNGPTISYAFKLQAGQTADIVVVNAEYTTSLFSPTCSSYTLELSVADDSTPPAITLTTPAADATYTLGQAVLANYACEDAESTVTQCEGTVASGSALDTSSVGAKSFTVNTASAGGENSTTHTYRVAYNFVGFSSPVDNNGVLNSAKAGQIIPLKWRLLDAAGTPVTNLSSVTVTAKSLTCSLGTSTDHVEEYATGSSGLQNLGDGYYQFNWKTPTTYAKSCKTMHLDLGEGATRTALFQFIK